MHILRLIRMRSAVRISPAAPKNTRFHHETGFFYVKNLSVLYLLYFRFSLHEKGQRRRSPGAASVLPDLLQNTRDETRRSVPCVKNYRSRSLGRMPTCTRLRCSARHCEAPGVAAAIRAPFSRRNGFPRRCAHRLEMTGSASGRISLRRNRKTRPALRDAVRAGWHVSFRRQYFSSAGGGYPRPPNLGGMKQSTDDFPVRTENRLLSSKVNTKNRSPC